jgi:hypothetical protein
MLVEVAVMPAMMMVMPVMMVVVEVMPVARNPVALLNPAPAVPHRSANGADVLNEAAVGGSCEARGAR